MVSIAQRKSLTELETSVLFLRGFISPFSRLPVPHDRRFVSRFDPCVPAVLCRPSALNAAGTVVREAPSLALPRKP